MAALFLDRAVLSDIAWRLRQGESPPRLLQRFDGRLFYERPGMSALERVLYEAPSLRSRLEPVSNRDVVPHHEAEWLQFELLARAAGTSASVTAVSEDLNRALRGPARTPDEMIVYLIRLLLLAMGTSSDVLLWRPRASLLEAFLRFAGVAAAPVGDAGLEGWNVG